MKDRDAAGNRRLARFQQDPGTNPGAEETSVPHTDQYGDPIDEDEDRPVPAHVGEDCSRCDRNAEFSDPAEALGNPNLPSEPLCRTHILENS